MLLIPAIDLKNGRCVRLRQGLKSSAKVYDGDPVETARRFEDEGAPMLHVVDLDGAFGESRSPNRSVAEQIITAVQIPVQFGGGMRSIEDVHWMIEAGAQRVVLGTLAVESRETLSGLVKLFGPCVAVGIDARAGQVVTHGWERRAGVTAVELAREVARAGVGRVVYTDVGRDGTLEGVNVEQTRIVARESGLKVTASGGVASLKDIGRVALAAADGVDSLIVGRALYEKRFTLRDALRAAGGKMEGG